MDVGLVSQINILQETRSARALPFLKNYLAPIGTRSQRVHFVCFREPPDSYKWILTPSSKYYFYDVFTDPLGWNAPSKSLHQVCSLEDNFLKLIGANSNSEDGENEKEIVVFDGLNSLIRHKGIHSVGKLISNFAVTSGNANISHFIGIAESELLSELELNALRYIAHSFIQLSTEDTDSNGHQKAAECPLRYVVDMTVKRRTGKVVREVGIYYFTNACKLMKSMDVIRSKDEDDTVDEKSDPMARLTFRLNLSDHEKAARSQVKLPYMLDEEHKATQLDRTTGGGRIVYERDDADDFDEEDPDDDLDI